MTSLFTQMREAAEQAMEEWNVGTAHVHFAIANPQNVLALLSALEGAERALEALRHDDWRYGHPKGTTRADFVDEALVQIKALKGDA